MPKKLPKEEIPPIWQCEDGRLMLLSEMTLSHLNNCIAMVLFRNEGRGWRHRFTEPLLLELKRRKDRGEA